ncbi:MAG: hypothetical protein V1821_04505 [bacterium]
MPDIKKTGKRIFAVTVAVATMAWAVGLATLATPFASAATIASGSLIKGSLSAVYYYGADGKRYVFPNEKTYKTWYADFSTVQTISDTELASIMIGGNATYRPGVKMIKITSDPRTYAVSKGGVLRWIKSEAIAIALYGTSWNQMIEDVSDAFFTNYTIGADINVASDYSASMELAAATSINVDKGIGSTPATGNVTVSLSPSSPASMSIPGTAFYAPLLTLNIVNNSASEARLTGLSIRKTGIIADSSVAGVLVTDAAGILHGSLVTFGQGVASPGFANDPIKVAANSSTTVTVNTNIGNVASGTLGASILAATDVMMTDSTGATMTVGGVFPISGNQMTVVNGAGSIGAVTVAAQPLIGGTSNNNAVEIDQGVQNLDIAKFSIQETTGVEGTELMNLELQNGGSASSGDFNNIRLVDQDGAVVATVDGVINNIAKFSILSLTGGKAGPHGGYLIPAGQTRYFTVRMDTSANTNAAGRAVNFTVQNSFRVRALGVQTGVGVTPTLTVGVSTVGDNTNWVVFRTGSLTIARSTDSNSGKIAKGATNVALASFDLRAYGEPIEIQEATWAVNASPATGIATGRRTLNGTIKINNGSGSTVYSETASNPSVYGGTCTIANNTTTGNCAGSGAATSKILSSYSVIQPGTTGKLVFVADIDQNATSLDTYQVRLVSVRFRQVYSNITATSAVFNVDGNQLQVEDSSLTVSRSPSYNPVNLVRGGSLQKIGSFSLQAGSAEGVRITTMLIRIGAKNGAINAVGDFAVDPTSNITNVSNVTLMEGNNQLAPASNITTTAGGTFSTGLVVDANSSKTIDVYGVVSSSFSATNVGVSLTPTSVTGLQSQTALVAAQATQTIGQSITVTSGGNLAVTDVGNDGVINVAKLLHAGETDIPMFKFKLRETTNAETLSVGKLYLGVKNARNTFMDFKLFNEATGLQLDGTATANIIVGVNGEIRFGGLNLTVPKGGELTLVVKGSVVGAATMPTDIAVGQKDVTMGVTFVEFTGDTSGITNRISGGMLLGQSATNAAAVAGTFTPAGDFLVVNDLNSFEVGDLVNFDGNNDGAFTAATFAAQGGTIPETSPMYVNTVGTLSLNFASYYRATAANNAADSRFTLVAGGEGLVVDASPAIAIGDTVRIDANADGDFADTFGTGGAFSEATVYTIGAVALGGSPDTFDILAMNMGVIGGNGARIYVTSKNMDFTGALATTDNGTPVAQATIGGRLSAYAFGSQNHEVQEVEPVITGLDVGSGAQVSDNPIGTFVVRADGSRSLTVNKLRFEITGSYNTTSNLGAFAPRNFRLDRADPTTGARLANQMINGTTLSNGSAAGSVKLAYSPSAGVLGGAMQACGGAAPGVGATTLQFDLDAGVCAAGVLTVTNLAVNDRISFGADTNGGIGYRVTSISSCSGAGTCTLTITPGLQVGVALGSAFTKVTATPAIALTSILESGAVVEFDLALAGLNEEISAGASKGYVFLADTTRIKDNSQNGSTASTQARLLGSKASPAGTPVTDGLEWTYIRTADNGAMGALTISDSYIVSGKAITYQ